jgi:hypothetical protein
LLSMLQRIKPSLKEIKITRKKAPGVYLELMKVFKNHSRASDYMIQFSRSHSFHFQIVAIARRASLDCLSFGVCLKRHTTCYIPTSFPFPSPKREMTFQSGS